MKKITMIKWSFLAMAALGMMTTSCTKFDTPPYVEEDASSGSGRISINKYVLWVNLEGAGGGDLVKNALPDDGMIKSLLPHSRYAWSGLEAEHVNDYQPTEENAVACASMLTGNLPIRHGMTDDTYTSEQVYDPDFDEAMKVYSVFFQYIADYDKSMKSLAITPWKTQNQNLLNKASTVITSKSDEETLSTALDKLKNEDNRVIYLSFRGVLDAARNGGWQSGNVGYIQAMQTMDNYVGQLMKALEERPEAYYEDWLVIITSNHGGTESGSFGGNSKEERNMFGIFYYSHFSNPQEMNPGLIEDDVMSFDRSFRGVVIDSITSNKSIGGKPEYRQIYSLDSLRGGFTVEYIMAARPSSSRSYIPGGQSGVTLMSKSSWNLGMYHTYASGGGSFFGKGIGGTIKGCFVNPMIHTYTATMNMQETEEYDFDSKEEDSWGNKLPVQKKRKGQIDVKGYYDGIHQTTSTTESTIDELAEKFRDNSNLTIYDGLRWSCRYILELRIWNKELDEREVAEYSSRLKLTKENCDIYDNLIGYWQFYKGAEGQYLKEDSLVVNQIPKVKKNVRLADGTIEERDIETEPIRLRKKDAAGYYVPIDKEDIKYMTLANTLQSTMDEKGRMMESTLPVPAVLDWLGVSFPLEATRGSGSGAYKCSKLDGLSYFQNYTGLFAWYGTFLGNYQQDLEWRDYE